MNFILCSAFRKVKKMALKFLELFKNKEFLIFLRIRTEI